MRRLLNLSVLTLILALIIGVTTEAAKASQQPMRLSDDVIEKVIEYRLMRAGIMQGNDIDIDADDGVVELDGKVLSWTQKRRAERIAYGVDDVLRVENKLEVESRFRNDQVIANEVSKDIRSHPYFDIFDWVEGRVNNGVVTLTGAVREPWRKDEYREIAEDVLGVKEVNNQIEVLPTSIYDDRIRVRAARLIYRDPRFARYSHMANPPIHIIVDQGRITLEGSVVSSVEKQLIGARVRSGTLAFDVVNNLKVGTDRYESEE